MKNRLVITGMGAITPIGLNVESYWQNLLAGKSGVVTLSRFDASRLPVRIAAEIRDFKNQEDIPAAVMRSSSLFMRYAYAAAEEAITQAELDRNQPGERVGICMGSAMAGVEELTKSGMEYDMSSSGRVSPHLVPRAIPNMASTHIGIQHGFFGPGLTLSTACSAGSDAVLTAAWLLLAGEADAMLVMGGENIISAPIISSLAQARALSRHNDEPARASRPFDRDRDGFVVGEGGGAIVLETEENARKRGAQIFAELCGWGNTLDSWHITAPDPDGNGAARCMQAALKRAGLKPGDVDYINAHGTATQLGDKAETKAIKKVFGAAAAPPVSSTKGATGHLMGAGGLTELVTCVKSIQTGVIPPTLNLENPDPECDLDYVPNNPRNVPVNVAMSNSLGFGGQNSTLIVRRFA